MRRQSDNRPALIELFAGAGVFGYAFAKEGFAIVQAVEVDANAARTYAQNVGPCIQVGDVRRVKPSRRCDILIAGPPCQGFSTLGKRNIRDPRNRLSYQVLQWVKATSPKIVVIENVAAFLDSMVWRSICGRLRQMGYEVDSYVLDAVNFGVPQLRRRSFTFASRVGIPRITKAIRKAPTTVSEAWAGLPAIPNNRNHHNLRLPSPLALSRMRVIPPGGDKRDVMRTRPELAPPSWWTLNCQITDVWGRMEWDQPSNTLRTCLLNPSKGRYIHPEQDRVITIREAARLHTIPDTWIFHGTPYQIAKQIGNSVPLNLGRSVARSVRKQLT